MPKTGKKRLDILVYENGLASSREKAKALIMSGVILVNGEREDKPGSEFPEDAQITMKGKPLAYVSRGGLKLEKAILTFGLELKGKICFDAGASTGGFTDCMLQNGAVKVYAADVGYGQLDWKLRSDERVVCMEKCNVRYLTPEMIDDVCSFASIDVSFISLTRILPAVSGILTENGQIVALIKPQFEAGREKIGKKGVVKDRATHREVIRKVVSFALTIGLSPEDLTFSPVKGPEGNIEYLALFTKKAEDMTNADLYDIMTEDRKNTDPSETEQSFGLSQHWTEKICSVVEEAHLQLDRHTEK